MEIDVGDVVGGIVLLGAVVAALVGLGCVLMPSPTPRSRPARRGPSTSTWGADVASSALDALADSPVGTHGHVDDGHDSAPVRHAAVAFAMHAHMPSSGHEHDPGHGHAHGSLYEHEGALMVECPASDDGHDGRDGDEGHDDSGCDDDGGIDFDFD